MSFRHRGNGQLWTWQFCDPANPEAIVRHVPSARMVVDDGSTIWRLMREGLGITWAPAWLGVDDLRSGQVVEILKPWRRPEFQLSAVRLDRRHTPERTRAILDFLEEVAPAWRPES